MISCKDGSLPTSALNNCSSVKFSKYFWIKRFGRVPKDLRPTAPERIICTKMLRNFVQIIRSGAVGRKSLGTRPKRLIQKYLENLTDEQLFKADVGNDPSLQDIIKLVHPKPSNKKRSAMYGYLL